ncbi:MAG: sulfotransferase family 2 domain-containing protein [Methyloceanibacter sp.]
MILSRSHRFIFIRTRKVGGTSVELFLSRFCGDDDIVTPLRKEEEPLREGMGPRNFRLPGYGKRTRPRRILGSLLGKPAIGYGGFYNHIPAGEVRRLVGEDVWNRSFKFTIERNPWDRQVSLYNWHYRGQEPKPSFERFILSPFRRKISPNFDTYAIDGKIAVDYVCRYESLEANLAHVLKRMGIDAEVELLKVKGGYRDDRTWRDYYTPRTRDIVGRWYAREIADLGYAF